MPTGGPMMPISGPLPPVDSQLSTLLDFSCLLQVRLVSVFDLSSALFVLLFGSSMVAVWLNIAVYQHVTVRQRIYNLLVSVVALPII